MTNLNLSKPICFFDLETTGINVATDRIVEIALLKVHPNGNKESKSFLVNPGMKIPKQSSDIHGITDEKIANEPSFKELAPQVLDFIKGCDLGGYNSNRFDIPLLAEEFLRNDFDFDFSKHKSVDVQVIFYKMEPRTLTAAYKYYCDKDLVNAHAAEADTLATYEVLEAQIAKYPELKGDMNFLSEFSSHNKNRDLAGMIGENEDGEATFNFGKHKGKKVTDIFEQEPGYYAWIQRSDFPLYTKKILTAIKLEALNG